MRKLSLVVLIPLLFFAEIILAQSYVQVWGDEFNIPGLPDSTKWGYEIGKIRNSELQYYTYKRSENARIEDTLLIIEARKEIFENAKYTAASITSKGIGDWLYGKIEISAKVPTGKGSWPALWMMPTTKEYGGWPRSGEIDIMEYIGVEPENLFYTCHLEGTDGTGKQQSGSGGTHTIIHPYNQFIKYTLIWTPKKIEWFANDVKYHEYIKTSDDYKVWPFNKLFHLKLNLAWGGSWGGYAGVDDSKLPLKFLIDYVRVFQLQETKGPFSFKLNPSTGGTVDYMPKLDKFPEATEITITAKPENGYNFGAWQYYSAANPYSFKIYHNTEISSLFIQYNQLLTNSSFDENYKPWTFFVDKSSTIEYEKDVENGVFVVNIMKSPIVDWKLGFQEVGLSLDKGEYSLSFDAYAENPNELLINISKYYDDYGSIITKHTAIKNTKENFRFTLKMPVSDNNVRLYFGIGNFSGKFFIDNISLQKIDDGSNTSIFEYNNEIRNENNSFKLYPNPCSGIVNVEISKEIIDSKTSIQFFDMTGKLVQEKPVLKNKFEYELSNLKSGIYFARLNSIAYSGIQTVLLIK